MFFVGAVANADDSKSNKNAISLIAGASPTALTMTKKKPKLGAETGYEADVGLMYQRDFDDIRGSVAVTIRGTGFLGVGLVF